MEGNRSRTGSVPGTVRAAPSPSDDIVNLLGGVGLPILWLDHELRVCRFTNQVAEIAHITLDDIGCPLADLPLRFDDPRLVADARRILSGGRAPAREVCGERDRWWSRHAVAYRDADDQIAGVIVVLNDVTAPKRSHRQHLAGERQQAAIAELSRLALSHSTLDALLGRTVEAVRSGLDADRCEAFEVDVTTRLARRLAVAVRELPPPIATPRRPPTVDYPITTADVDQLIAADSPLGRALIANRALYFTPPADDPDPEAVGRETPSAAEPSWTEAVIWLDEIDGVACALVVTAGQEAPRSGAQAFLQSVANVLREASSRLDNERRLYENQLRWRLALDAAHMGSWDWDLVTGAVRWDPATLRLAGLSDAPPSIEDFLGHVPPERLPAVREALFAAIGSGTAYDAEFPFVRPDRQELWLAAKGTCVLGPTGAPARLTGVFYDITARKRAEEIAELRADELRERDRRKDEFLAMLSHELRNPLAALGSGLELLTQLTSDHNADVQGMMRRQLDQLRRLLDDLLDVTRITTGKLELEARPVDLATAVDVAVDQVTAAIERRDQFLVRTVTPGLWVHGDFARLVQVISNLLHNASKYSGPRSRVEIDATRRDDHAVVRVSDDGIGIEPDLLPHVFDAFYQANQSLARRRGGLGLGLTLVRQLVERHGGTVRAHSDGKDRGSVFEIHLPLLSPLDWRPTTPQPAPVARPALATRSVLVVDDNRDLVAALVPQLQRAGLRVTVAHDGATAVALALRDLPEAMLIDIGLPGLDGFQVVGQLRGQPALATTRFIAVTGYRHPDYLEQARRSGFTHYLTKPVDLATLLAVLDEPRPEPG